MSNGTEDRRSTLAILTLFSMFLFSCALVYGQEPRRGTINGTVTADQAVRGFRVRAHNVTNRIWYDVFTKDGRYTVPQALPGSYDVHVEQEGYDSPTMSAQVGAGQTVRLDFAIKKTPPSDVAYMDYDQLYPPGPARDLIEKTCMGCHGNDFYNAQHRSEAGWRGAVYKMTNGPLFNPDGPSSLSQSQLSAKERDIIVQYLTMNFGPNSPNRDLKRYPVPVDEDALSRAIYVEYDAPDFQPDAPYVGAYADGNSYHDGFISPVDDTTWWTAAPWNAMVHLDPRDPNPKTRWKVFSIPPLPGRQDLGMHGLTVDTRGFVYWAEEDGGRVGELDPATGESTRFKIPTVGSLLQVLFDKPADMVWYGMAHGNAFGAIDLKTKMVHQWPIPTSDCSPYGMVEDQKGNIWAACYAKGLAIKFDPVAQVYTEYTPPTKYSGARRIGVDSKGIIWFSEYRVSQIASLNPETGQIKEYKYPMPYVHPYESWVDKTDNVWNTDHFYNMMSKFDQKSQKWTYYPQAQLNMNIPKIEVEANNTIWSGSRGGQNWTSVHFYPNGYGANAPPEP